MGFAISSFLTHEITASKECLWWIYKDQRALLKLSVFPSAVLFNFFERGGGDLLLGGCVSFCLIKFLLLLKKERSVAGTMTFASPYNDYMYSSGLIFFLTWFQVFHHKFCIRSYNCGFRWCGRRIKCTGSKPSLLEDLL